MMIRLMFQNLFTREWLVQRQRHLLWLDVSSGYIALYSRSSYSEVFCKKGVLRIFTKCTRLIFSRLFDIRGNLGKVKEKPTGKTCFSSKMKCLALHIYLAKFCEAAFLWCQRSFYCNFMRKGCWNGGNMWKVLKTKAWA